MQYLEPYRDGQYAAAARFLDMPPAMEQRGPELARRLKAVFDRYMWFDMAAISDSPGGNSG